MTGTNARHGRNDLDLHWAPAMRVARCSDDSASCDSASCWDFGDSKEDPIHGIQQRRGLYLQRQGLPRVSEEAIRPEDAIPAARPRAMETEP